MLPTQSECRLAQLQLSCIESNSTMDGLCDSHVTTRNFSLRKNLKNTEKKPVGINYTSNNRFPISERPNPLGCSFHAESSVYCCEPKEESDTTEIPEYITALEERPVPIGQENSPLKRDSKFETSFFLKNSNRNIDLQINQRVSYRRKIPQKTLQDSDLHLDCENTNENIHFKSSNITVNSDASTFMDKPLCDIGVKSKSISKSKKKILTDKLKRVGLQLQGSKKNSLKTLAVL